MYYYFHGGSVDEVQFTIQVDYAYTSVNIKII